MNFSLASVVYNVHLTVCFFKFFLLLQFFNLKRFNIIEILGFDSNLILILIFDGIWSQDFAIPQHY